MMKLKKLPLLFAILFLAPFCKRVYGTSIRFVFDKTSESGVYANISRGFSLYLMIFLIVFVVAIVFYAFLKRRKKRMDTIKKNLEIVDEYYSQISKMIIELDENIPYLKLVDDYDVVKEKYDEAVMNFSRLKDYYDGIRSSYSDDEFEVFLNIYKIIKDDLDAIKMSLQKAQDKIEAEIRKRKRFDELVLSIKNKDLLGSRIDSLYQYIDDPDVLDDKLKGIKKLDEVLEKYKTFSLQQKQEYILKLVNKLTTLFEEKYPLILAKLGHEFATETEKQYDELLKNLKSQDDDIEKLILAEEFIIRLCSMDQEIEFEEHNLKVNKDKLYERFLQIKSEYEKESFKFYLIDLQIEKAEQLFKSNLGKNLEKELQDTVKELETLYYNFKNELDFSKKLISEYENLLQKYRAKLISKGDFDTFLSYRDEMRSLLFECRFDELKSRYYQIESIINDIIIS